MSRREELEQKLSDCRTKAEEIEAELASIGIIETPTSGSYQWVLSVPYPKSAISTDKSYYGKTDELGSAVFADETQCKNWAEALNLLLLLHKKAGTVRPTDEKQWVITLDVNCEIEVLESVSLFSKTQMISPCFKTKEYAQAAADSLNLVPMFKTMKGL